MPPASSPVRRAPRAGLLLAAVAVLTALVVFAATRGPAPDRTPAIGSPQGAPVVPAEDGGRRPTAAAPDDGRAARAPASAPAASPPPAREPAPAASPAPPASACLPPDHPPVSPAAGSQVTIQWLGYACFYIHSPGGIAVVTDPFDPAATGLPAPATGAHLVTVSTDAPEHSAVGVLHAFQGDRLEVVRGAGARRGDVRIVPVPTAGPGGRRNVAYRIEAGPLRIAHLGALGAPLTPEQRAALGPVDVVLVPAGGREIPPEAAAEAAKQIGARIVIPMTYSTVEMSGPAAKLRPVDAFVAATPWAVTRIDADVMLLSPAELPPSTEIYVLDYER